MRRLTLLPVLATTAVALGGGFVVTVLLPTADAANTTRTDATRQYTKGEVAGRGIYASEGCVYCHTQQVRDTFTDAGLASRPTRAGDTLNDAPGLFGTPRFGPDLSCVGDRVPGLSDGAEAGGAGGETGAGGAGEAGEGAAAASTSDAAETAGAGQGEQVDADEQARLDAMIDYLRHPAEVHHGSTMPSYGHLDATDLRRLASYLISLRCDSEGGNRTAEAGQ